MHTIQIRDVPEDVYQNLASAAKRNHRSLRGEILHMLESAYSNTYKPNLDDLHKEIAAVRESIAGRYGTAPSSVSLIREDRDTR